MSDRPIRLAVIGHTNTGKTSVLRSLLRDATLGEVADAAGTTRSSQRYTMRLGGAERAVFWDTPGLENAALALEHLRRLETEHSLSGAAAMDALLARSDPAIEKDLRPLRTLGECDAGLLVFDARERPLRKYWEEHELLRRCGRPIVAVLNCTADEGALTAEWDTALRKNGLHAVVRYDAWAASERDAAQLFVKLRELLDEQWAGEIRSIIAERRALLERRVGAMCEELATLLVDLATLRVVTVRERRAEGEGELGGALGAGWVRFRRALAELHGIPPERLDRIEAELAGQAAGDADPLRGADTKLTVGSAVAAVAGGILAGGVKGGLIDVGTGGATLGLGMVVGGAAGVALGGRELVRFASMRARGEIELALRDDALAAVLARGCWLIERVQAYGAASERAMGSSPTPPAGEELRVAIEALNRARRHREWCRLSGSRGVTGPRPEACLRTIRRLGGLLSAIVLDAPDE